MFNKCAVHFRFLIKHLPKQMSKLRNDKAELEDKILDLEARLSQMGVALAEMERRGSVYKREAEDAKAAKVMLSCIPSRKLCSSLSLVLRSFTLVAIKL